MAGPDLSYQVEGLRTSGAGHAAVSETCGQVQQALDGHGIVAPMLGTVPAAGPFHAMLAHVVAAQSTDAAAEATRRSDLAARAGRTAGSGAGLVDETTRTARDAPVSAPPGT